MTKTLSLNNFIVRLASLGAVWQQGVIPQEQTTRPTGGYDSIKIKVSKIPIERFIVGNFFANKRDFSKGNKIQASPNHEVKKSLPKLFAVMDNLWSLNDRTSSSCARTLLFIIVENTSDLYRKFQFLGRRKEPLPRPPQII
ncbi:hypothetical protein M3G15_09540 [Paenibacillus sp. p3-SID1389]|uniref:hypothetical protein n=1 Tax=Paenibacillus sp. p3-SID1389 TaxID=2916364 RepID=UPI0021A96803|nr:hypothetical protein [Paenibacillus sp. p3-SID1389]MCT2195383.1 hypothetical protein [Paenibacillus sp. p3-SID1389]